MSLDYPERPDPDANPTEFWRAFIRDYYTDAVSSMQLAPGEYPLIEISWDDLATFYPAIELEEVDIDEVLTHLRGAVLDLDTPVAAYAPEEVSISLVDLPEERVYDIGRYPRDAAGSYLAINGQVSHIDRIKDKITLAVYNCLRCGTTQEIPQGGDDEIDEPHECPGCERQGPFMLDKEASEVTQRRLVRLSPPPEISTSGAGHIDIELEDALTHLVHPGERVRVFGRLEAHPESEGSRILEYSQSANSVAHLNAQIDALDIEEHREAIEAIASLDDPIEAIKDSFAPHLHRDESLDAAIEGIVLQLFGATRAPRWRSDIHVLLLGDPSTAKSELLEFAESVHPRAKFKSGRSVSGTGLTAATVKDEFGSEAWSVKAGLLVLANEGLAILDEVDKVPDSALQAAHSALENQRVSHIKAGIEAEMPARTSLLAAGNPKHGRFDIYEPINEQIEFDASLTSRFDLIFMLQDLPDSDRDGAVVRQITRSIYDSTAQARGEDMEDRYAPEYERELIAAYVAHARDTVHPQPADESVLDPIEAYYSDVREKHEDAGAIPLTARYAEAMLRLAYASARARMSDVVEPDDVHRAIELVKSSLYQCNVINERGEFDVDVIETGISQSQRDRIKLLRELIDMHDTSEEGAPVDLVIEEATSERLDAQKARDTLEHMLKDGEAYHPTNSGEEFVRLT
jgi:replicative DNA helicase Mcm